MAKVLVTGCAGFIGFHLARRLAQRQTEVIGIDNLNEYYDVTLKQGRLAQLAGYSNFCFLKMDLADADGMAQLFRSERFDTVVNLGAQAGVRYSLTNPQAYVKSNLAGFTTVLEGCRHGGVRHLVFASSSSVYGANTRMPFSVHDPVDHPVSFYGATKRANELMAHTYSHLYALPCTGLRFFTVYGPWGRPDMALFLFTRAILKGEPIDVFQHGKMQRDFTYIDDVVEAVLRVMGKVPQPNPAWDSDRRDPSQSSAPYRIYNVGNHHPVDLMSWIALLEAKLGRKAKINFLPLQAGDVPATYADVDDLAQDLDFRPQTPVEEGVTRFVEWYREYYSV